jgi:hypothetical protein
MKRVILVSLAVLVVANVALLWSGYGIRVKEKPCTYFVGFITMANFLRHDCPRFGVAWWAIP